MKKVEFELPMADVVLFQSEDVITTSDPGKCKNSPYSRTVERIVNGKKVTFYDVITTNAPTAPVP